MTERLPRPRFKDVFVASYWDMVRILRQQWKLCLIAVAILLAYFFLGSIRRFPLFFTQHPVGIHWIQVLVGVVAIVFLTPILIGMHRFIMFGETPAKYTIDFRNPRFKSYFLALSGLWLFFSLRGLLFALYEPVGTTYYVVLPDFNPPPALLGALWIISIFVFARLIILFGALAAEAPGSSIANAWSDTRKRTQSLVLYILIVPAPLLLALAVLGYLIRQIAWHINNDFGDFIGLLGLPILIAAQLAGIILLVSIASRAYRAFSNRLNQPPAQPETRTP